MASITFCGHDFADFTSNFTRFCGAHNLTTNAVTVPGRPGAVVQATHIEPMVIEVDLRLALDDARTDAQMMGLRREVRAWLSQMGSLTLPEEPGLEWRDVVCAGASSWDSLFECGECTLRFVAYDPIAYGREVEARTSTFTVGGTWPTEPVVEMVSNGGGYVMVADATSGKFVRVDKDFSAGDVVRVEHHTGMVSVGKGDGRRFVALGSDFFRLEPGEQRLSFTGCSDFSINFTERWA